MNQAKIIAIANPKGGVGKSNTTRTLAQGLNLNGSNAIIGETDPQNSLLEWSLQKQNDNTTPVINFNASSETALRKSIRCAVEEARSEIGPVDYVVIDGCAFDFRFLNSVLNVSDLVIIPTQASPDDICQLGEVIELTHAIQLKRVAKSLPQLLARTVINKARIGTTLLKQTQELLKNPNNTGIFCLKTVVRDYEAIRRAADKGKTAFESGNKNARIDAQNLTNEILELLQ